jgi:tyramine---L-glutamate ligase
MNHTWLRREKNFFGAEIAGKIMQQDTMLIVEFTTAGGVVKGMERAADISIEGLAMVKALVDDAIAGDFNVHVLLHESIEPVIVTGESHVTVHPVTNEDKLAAKLEEIAPGLDHCFLVAPEFGSILHDLTCLLESTGCHVISQPSCAIFDASDKKRSLDRLAIAGIHVPRSQGLGAFLQDPTFPFPVVVKPVHGAGCIGVFKACDEADVRAAMVADAKLQFANDELLVQEFIEGEQLSASAIATKESCYLLGINEQFIALQQPNEIPSKYAGGIVGPIHPESWETCSSIACTIATEFSLEGYFGFDFILDAQDVVVVVEINPRLTTSFVGLKILHGISVLRFIAGSQGNTSWPVIEFSGKGFACYELLERDSVPGEDGWLENVLRRASEHDVLAMKKGEQHVAFFVSSAGVTRQGALDAVQDVVEKMNS